MLSTMIEQGRKWINVNMLRFISVTLSKRLHFPGKSQCSITGKLFLEQALAQLMPASTRLMTAEYMSTECEGVFKETLSNMLGQQDLGADVAVRRGPPTEHGAQRHLTEGLRAARHGERRLQPEVGGAEAGGSISSPLSFFTPRHFHGNTTHSRHVIRHAHEIQSKI